MAALPGDRLTSAYRANQVRNAAMLAATLRRRYAGVDLSNSATQRNFLDLATRDVVTHHHVAVDQAVVYLRSLHSIESSGLVVVEPGPPPNLEQIRRSLAAVGLGAGRLREDRVQGSDEDGPRRAQELRKARSITTAAVMGAGIRHAQNGARDTVRQYVEREERAKGFVRTTAGDDKVCFFCAMLASRIDWKEGSFDEIDAQFEGPGTAKVHDSCRCHLRPIYSRVLPDETMQYRQWWQDMSGEAIDGNDRGMLKNFRSQWERKQRGGDSDAQPSRVA